MVRTVFLRAADGPTEVRFTIRSGCVFVDLWISGSFADYENRARRFGPALMPYSLKRTQDLSYDLPPTDEGKGETGAESDRYLGNPTVTHQTVLIRYPAGTMTGSRQKNAAGMKTIGLRNRASHFTAKRRSAIHAVFAAQHGAPSTGPASLRQQ